MYMVGGRMRVRELSYSIWSEERRGKKKKKREKKEKKKIKLNYEQEVI